MDNFFPSPTSEDNLDYTPIIGDVIPMVLEDIEMVINSLEGGKAPGLEQIDFWMWRAVFTHDKEFILDLINICFKFNYFPEHLKNARVFFLLKDGKDPGIPPLHIVAKDEFIKFRIWVKRSNEYNTIVDINLLDKHMPFTNIPSRQRLINLDSNIPNSDYDIYTDGSRIENETGFAPCILKDETNIQNHLFKLNTFNSVFQAELAAIEFAVNWDVKEKVKVNIHTDSLSSRSVINSANTRSEFVNKVKSNIFKAKNMVGLSCVEAHVGVSGNELADQQDKLAITSGDKLFIPVPYSHLKCLLKIT
ncbi:hypothetical protein AVEN_198541-1 [Araneus ventricosus]|uniref:RNase H type-1 domain-containing protein n=1 Tax=Araneus ventricosus TaxID=182803 RepID=A0A4Y2HWD3_ARAVE|nr:hypothetical protein AVEN_198541-1 [Araneus ventricosus]